MLHAVGYCSTKQVHFSHHALRTFMLVISELVFLITWYCWRLQTVVGHLFEQDGAIETRLFIQLNTERDWASSGLPGCRPRWKEIKLTTRCEILNMVYDGRQCFRGGCVLQRLPPGVGMMRYRFILTPLIIHAWVHMWRSKRTKLEWTNEWWTIIDDGLKTTVA